MSQFADFYTVITVYFIISPIWHWSYSILVLKRGCTKLPCDGTFGQQVEKLCFIVTAASGKERITSDLTLHYFHAYCTCILVAEELEETKKRKPLTGLTVFRISISFLKKKMEIYKKASVSLVRSRIFRFKTWLTRSFNICQPFWVVK